MDNIGMVHASLENILPQSNKIIKLDSDAHCKAHLCFSNDALSLLILSLLLLKARGTGAAAAAAAGVLWWRA